MEKNSRCTRSCGFTLVEVLVTTLLVLVLGGLAIYNFTTFKTSSYNSVAQSDLRNIQTAIEAANSNTEQQLSYLIFNEYGPIDLPAPLTSGKLSKDVHLQYLVKINLLGLIDLTTMQLTHTKGNKVFRYVNINGKAVAQTFPS